MHHHSPVAGRRIHLVAVGDGLAAARDTRLAVVEEGGPAAARHSPVVDHIAVAGPRIAAVGRTVAVDCSLLVAGIHPVGAAGPGCSHRIAAAEEVRRSPAVDEVEAAGRLPCRASRPSCRSSGR